MFQVDTITTCTALDLAPDWQIWTKFHFYSLVLQGLLRGYSRTKIFILHPHKMQNSCEEWSLESYEKSHCKTSWEACITRPHKTMQWTHTRIEFWIRNQAKKHLVTEDTIWLWCHTATFRSWKMGFSELTCKKTVLVQACWPSTILY